MNFYQTAILFITLSSLTVFGAPAPDDRSVFSINGQSLSLPSMESLRNLDMNSIKNSINNLGLSEKLQQTLQDPQSSLMNAYKTVSTLANENAQKAYQTSKDTASKVLESTKTFAGEHVRALDDIMKTAGVTSKDVGQTLHRLIMTYPAALGIDVNNPVQSMQKNVPEPRGYLSF